MSSGWALFDEASPQAVFTAEQQAEPAELRGDQHPFFAGLVDCAVGDCAELALRFCATEAPALARQLPAEACAFLERCGGSGAASASAAAFLSASATEAARGAAAWRAGRALASLRLAAEAFGEDRLQLCDEALLFACRAQPGGEESACEQVELRALALVRRLAEEEAGAFQPLPLAPSPPAAPLIPPTLPPHLVSGPHARPGAAPAAALPARPYAGLGLPAFLREQVLPSAPVLLQGAALDWPALRDWPQLALWAAPPLGRRTVPVELGGGGGPLAEEQSRLAQMTLSAFCHAHLAPSVAHTWASPPTTTAAPPAYVSQHGLLEQLPQLASHIAVPRLAFARLAACNAWLGTAGTITALHTDDAHNLLVGVAGWKLVRLILPRARSGEEGARALALALRACAHPRATAGATLNLFSEVDAEGAEAGGALAAAGAVLLEGVLAPGDALYIPRGAWHYVRALTPAMVCARRRAEACALTPLARTRLTLPQSVNFWF